MKQKRSASSTVQYISNKWSWYDESERECFAILMSKWIPIDGILMIITSFRYLKFQLFSPILSGEMTHFSETKDRDEEDDKPYWFQCPLRSAEKLYNVFEIEHPEDSKGQQGEFASYFVQEKWISRFRVTEYSNIGNDCPDAVYNGILYDGGQNNDENVRESVSFDNQWHISIYNYRPVKGYRIEFEARFVNADDLHLLERKTAKIQHIKTGFLQIVGMTTDQRFVCAFRQEVKIEDPQSELSKLFDFLRRDPNTDIFSEDSICNAPLLLLDTGLSV